MWHVAPRACLPDQVAPRVTAPLAPGEARRIVSRHHRATRGRHLVGPTVGPWAADSTAIHRSTLALGLSPMTTLRIKLSRCHLCNATKTRPSPTAYVFCDFCGALIDFDFQTAISDPRSKLPGPEYERLRAALAPQLEKAQQRGDKDAYLELQRKLFAAYVEACPAACSPRINDPAYREKYLEHSARSATEGVFDPEMKAASDRQAAAMKALQWIPGGAMGVTCRPDTFWALYETVLEMAEVGKRMGERTGLSALQPDGDTPVGARIGLSLFVQGWLPYLKKPEIDELMRRTGLATEYVEPTAARSPHAHGRIPLALLPSGPDAFRGLALHRLRTAVRSTTAGGHPSRPNPQCSPGVTRGQGPRGATAARGVRRARGAGSETCTRRPPAPRSAPRGRGRP